MTSRKSTIFLFASMVILSPLVVKTLQICFLMFSMCLGDSRKAPKQVVYSNIFGLVMGHLTMLNPALEDHTRGDLGYLNSLFNRLLFF